jgi:hypothetical protein
MSQLKGSGFVIRAAGWLRLRKSSEFHATIKRGHGQWQIRKIHLKPLRIKDLRY